MVSRYLSKATSKVRYYIEPIAINGTKGLKPCMMTSTSTEVTTKRTIHGASQKYHGRQRTKCRPRSAHNGPDLPQIATRKVLEKIHDRIV